MKMKYLWILATVLLTGCYGGRPYAKTLEAAAKDKATVRIIVRNPMYGEFIYERVNADTNSMPHAISTTGEMTVGYPPKQ